MRPVPVPPKKPPLKPKSKLPWKMVIAVFLLIVMAVIVIPKVYERSSSGTKMSPKLNRAQFSVNDPASIWAVVNKGRALPSSYNPSDLLAPNVALRLPATDPEMQIRATLAAPLQQMFKEADAEGLQLMLSSGYRSYQLQNIVYKANVGTQGQQTADSSSAKPGHSEHQTGLAVDIEPTSRECEVELCFADTPEGIWLAKNSYKYGFIIRYQKDQEKKTGYEYEPWHIRYVGIELAEQLHKSNQTLEQFFGLPAFTDYSPNPYILQAER
jgi:D-alanyl-D-alanine carboxypeptidase